MTATNTAFIFFNSFKQRLGAGDINLGNATASTFFAQLHHSGAGLSADFDASTLGSVLGTVGGAEGSARRYLANVVWTALSGAPTSQHVWDSDALVWTASGTMTTKFATFWMSVAAGSAYPIGYIGLVAGDTEVTAGNTVTLTPNTYWFRLSG